MYIAIFQTLFTEFINEFSALILFLPIFILSILSALMWRKTKYSKNQKTYLMIQDFVFSFILCVIIYYFSVLIAFEFWYMAIPATILYWFLIVMPANHTIIKYVNYEKDSLLKNTLIGIMYKIFYLIPLGVFILFAGGGGY